MDSAQASAHWEHVYGSRAADQLSWHQQHPEPSLRLIQDLAPSPQALQQVFIEPLHLRHQEHISHTTPAGVEQQFLYTIWQLQGTSTA